MKSYLKLLTRNKLFTAIEAVGLIVSMAFIVLLASYIHQQYAAAHIVPEYKDIYTVGSDSKLKMKQGFADEVRKRIPEVEIAGTYYNAHTNHVSIGSESIKIQVSSADADFFRILHTVGIDEYMASALDLKDNALISRSFARSYNISEGQKIEISNIVGNRHDFTVAGIFEDFGHTLLQYSDVIVSLDCFPNSSSEPSVLMKTMHGTDSETLYAKLEDLCKELYPDGEGFGSRHFDKLEMARLDEIFFSDLETYFNKGDRKTIRLFLFIELLLLICAVFNYINLNYALSSKRAKEIAVKKLSGASSWSVSFSLILQSTTFTLICFVLGLLLSFSFVPGMNTLLSNPDVAISICYTPVFLFLFIALCVSIGIVAGILPALNLSSFNALDIVNGRYRRISKMTVSKILIVLQNSAAVFLIALVLVMELQLYKSSHRPQHADISDVFAVLGFPLNEEVDGLFGSIPGVNRYGLSQGFPGIGSVTVFSKNRFGGGGSYEAYFMDSTAFRILNPDIIRDYGGPLVGAAWFSADAAEVFGVDDEHLDIDEILDEIPLDSSCDRIGGIIEELVNNPYNQGEEYPTVIFVEDIDDMKYGQWILETSGDHKTMKKSILSACKNAFPDLSILERSYYLEDGVIRILQPQRNNIRLVELFLFLIILVTLLGLVAMSTFFCDQKAKDTVIRKVFGGTARTEMIRNLFEYLVLVVISCIIGIPLAVIASARYLEGYIYRLENYWWVFLLASLVVMLIVILSVLAQTVKLAHSDPVRVLKSE